MRKCDNHASGIGRDDRQAPTDRPAFPARLARYPVLAGMTLMLASCTEVFEPSNQVTPITDDTIVSSTAALSHTFVSNVESRRIICSQSAPDAAFQQSESGDVSIALVSVSGDEKTAEGEESSETEMAGRSPALLATRELLFRACEFSRNFKLEKSEAVAIYNRTLDIVGDVLKTEATNTVVRIGENLSTRNASLPSAGAVTQAAPVATPVAGSSSRTATGQTGTTSTSGATSAKSGSTGSTGSTAGTQSKSGSTVAPAVSGKIRTDKNGNPIFSGD